MANRASCASASGSDSCRPSSTTRAAPSAPCCGSQPSLTRPMSCHRAAERAMPASACGQRTARGRAAARGCARVACGARRAATRSARTTRPARRRPGRPRRRRRLRGGRVPCRQDSGWWGRQASAAAVHASDCGGSGTSWAVRPRAKGSAVPKPQWSDFGAIWKTIREVDINAIRHEAERGVAIVCLGQPAALWWVDRFLRDGPNRYPLRPDPLALVPLAEAGDYLDLLRAADLLIVALDAASPLGDEELAGLQRLSTAPRPSQAVLLFGEDPGAPTPWSAYLDR